MVDILASTPSWVRYILYAIKQRTLWIDIDQLGNNEIVIEIAIKPDYSLA